MSLVFALTLLIALSLSALMLLPRVRADINFDSRATYFDNAAKFFIRGGSYIMLVSVMDFLVLGSPILQIENMFRGVGVISALGMAVTGNEKIHTGFVLVSVAPMIGFLSPTITY